MKLWRYEGFDPVESEWIEGFDHKAPEVWALTTPGSDYTNITTVSLRRKRIKQQYKARTVAGVDYYESIRQGWAFDVEEAGKSEADVFYIEDKLLNFITRVERGDWKTARNNLTLIVVEGAYTQAIHDDILGYVDDYILNNYE